MDKVTIKKVPFKLNGSIIKKGQTLSFKGVNRKNKEIKIEDVKGIKIISIFPDINTRICDAQTQTIARYASQHPEVHFISITMDDVDTINEWCLAKDAGNVDVWSDKKYKDFGTKTNTIIVKLNKLARGFIILDKENKIIDLSINKEIAKDPNYELVEKYLK